MSLPTQMQVLWHKQGPQINDLEQVQQPLPKISQHQVLVKVTAFGVNRADTLQRQGKYPPPAGESEVLGLEVSGTVVACGSQIQRWKCGNRVMGLVPGGGYAQYVAVHWSHLMPVPESLSMTAAAGLCEVFLTAYQSLFSLAQLQTGQPVLIHAGASGVGLAAIQLAKQQQCPVAVTASSAAKLTRCHQLGADVLINYQDQDFAEKLQQAQFSPQVVIDFVGADYTNRNLQVLQQDGVIIQLAMLNGRQGDRLDMAKLLQKRARIQGSTLRNRSDQYKAELINQFEHSMLAKFAQGQLQVVVDSVLAAEDIQQAHQRLEDNQTQGKLICQW